MVREESKRWESLIPAYIQKLTPYIPSKPDDVLKEMFGCQELHRLNNNENALGPVPEAVAALHGFVPEQAALYPSGDAYHLRCLLAARFGHTADSFLVGNGANEVIAFVIKAFCQAGDNIITADKTFAVYEWTAEFSGITARLVPLKQYEFDDEAMLQAIDERTKILFICNPNNPTGTYWSVERLRAFLDRIAGRQIVVIDEAYCEFVEASDFPNGMELIREYPNVVVFRTFSKMYGLAGLRIGYLAAAQPLVDVIRRTCIVYSINTVAQLAAMATLANDGQHVLATRRMVQAAKAYLCQEFQRMGLFYVAGEGNYLMLRLPLSDTLAYRKLMQQGFMVRTMTGFRFPNHIRITLQELSVMEGLVKALRNIL